MGKSIDVLMEKLFFAWFSAEWPETRGGSPEEYQRKSLDEISDLMALIKAAAKYFKAEKARGDNRRKFEDVRLEVVNELKDLVLTYSIESVSTWVFSNIELVIWLGIDFWRSVLIFDNFHDKVRTSGLAFSERNLKLLKTISSLSADDFYGDFRKFSTTSDSFPLSWNYVNKAPSGDKGENEVSELNKKIESLLLSKLRLGDWRLYLLAFLNVGNYKRPRLHQRLMMAIYFDSLIISRAEDKLESRPKYSPAKMFYIGNDIEYPAWLNIVFRDKKTWLTRKRLEPEKPAVIYQNWQKAGAAAARLGLSTEDEYRLWYKEDPRLPRMPDIQYSRFPGWEVFLGQFPTPEDFLSRKEVRRRQDLFQNITLRYFKAYAGIKNSKK